MSFHKADECFQDAKRYMQPENKPVEWDIVNGLASMNEALQMEIADLKNRLINLERAVSQT